MNTPNNDSPIPPSAGTEQKERDERCKASTPVTVSAEATFAAPTDGTTTPRETHADLWADAIAAKHFDETRTLTRAQLRAWAFQVLHLELGRLHVVEEMNLIDTTRELSDLRAQLATSQARLAEAENILGKRAHDVVGAAREAMMDNQELRSALAQAKQEVAEYKGAYNECWAGSPAVKAELDSLRAANTVLSAQVEELKRDGERLDWLADNSLWSGKPGVPGQLVCSPLKQPEGNGLRTAIDAAMEAKK